VGLKSEELRRRAEALLAVAPSADRRKVLAAYQPVVHMRGDASRGKEAFTKRCAQCHFFEGTGRRVGPELASVKDRSPAALLIAILDPNQAVESRYVEYAAELTDGRVFSGIVADETSTSLTLIGPEEKRQSILRSDLESLRSTGRSLMPEGLEKDLTQQDLADIIAFVGKSQPPRQFPGNAPAIVHAAADGTIALSATQARIYGPRLIFELKHQNLGWWATPNDRGEWTFESPAAGKYRIRLDYACTDSAAGNVFLLKIAGQEVHGKIASTGTWDDYQQVEIGELELPGGSCEAVMQSADHIHEALFDLRTIMLVPVKPSR
jgi:putative heme-binding domain-containing protein